MLRKRLLSLALTATLTLGAALVPTAAAAAAPAADPAHPIEVGGVAHPDDWAPPGPAAQSRSSAPEALAAVVPPANDDLANATVVSSLPYYSRSPYYGATFEEGESGECRTTDDDITEYFTPAVSSVWFSYTSTARQTLTFSGGVDGHYSIVAAYETAPVDQLVRISCAESEFREENYLQAEAGKTYVFQVSDTYYSEEPVQPGEQATLRISASAPVAGTTPADAVALSALPTTVSGSTLKVDSNWYEPYESCDGDHVLMGSIWHRFTATKTGSVLVDLRDSYFNPLGVIWESDGSAPTRPIGCAPVEPAISHQDYSKANAKTSFTATAGRTYFIQVGGYSWTKGDYVLTVSNVGTLTAPTPTISGDAGVGKTLTANPGTWGPSPVTLSYQWKDGNGYPIPGATAQTYTPSTDEAGSTVSVSVTGRKTGYADRTVDSAPLAIPYLQYTAAPAPTIVGTAAVGQTLTAKTGTWTPAPDYFNYSWERNGEYIASGPTYTIVAADRGASLTAIVSGSRSGYGSVPRESAPVVVPAPAQTLTPTPTVSGSTTVGSTLTASPGVWDPGTTLAYQWTRNGSTAITGATASTYLLTSADAGATLTVTVTSTKPGYSTATRTSAATATITGGSTSAITGPTPTITGTVQVGRTVTASAGTWAPAPVALAYQWKRGGVAIAGATAAAYTLVAADASTSLTVSVTGSKSGLAPVTRTSAASTVTPGLQTLMPTPTISGTLKVGSTLTATPGTWDAGTTLTYQWKRNAGTYIVGATKPTYVLTGSDAGATITVSVTSTKPGYSPATKSKGTTETVAVGTLTSATPTLTGTAAVGRTLTAVPGAWGPAPVTYAYQWKRGTTVISGATAATYTPVAGDAGASISVSVTGSKTGYTTVVKSSAAKTIAKGTLTAPTPTISGTAKVGSKLTAAPGTWGRRRWR
ncbi:hypothetical protein Q0F99_05990 [Rathayibacter oskolensis]|uniref:hypothetical protein n=1 Tax=Rathayibacter oskolensis TaxID=1891671 RepID=UPI00265DEA81|nr:hypothetical protein [Rathayibacter oskolensis]WKK72496.1 hypothetical protein Q0F99_05990 [Rathayibacter oskolensis]